MFTARKVFNPVTDLLPDRIEALPVCLAIEHAFAQGSARSSSLGHSVRVTQPSTPGPLLSARRRKVDGVSWGRDRGWAGFGWSEPHFELPSPQAVELWAS